MKFPCVPGLLSEWSEELGRLLLLRHQKDRNEQKSTSMPAMHQTMHKAPYMAPGPHRLALLENTVSLWPKVMRKLFIRPSNIICGLDPFASFLAGVLQ
ncbi:hypothetical protein AVEN_132857-1 [Araneus ventricosus]|uniref:Uncharacterized protein n=1 Tax=Araneus ventricosus TaxID=182803 RepID=A0A4Y2GTZ3_ARAVE|nr:hypothetical protein AVEN_132857-1 [Araneus ventricosus]